MMHLFQKEISLSGDALKIIACSTMLIDHVGRLFFPTENIWVIIGRIAFPLFAFLIAVGFIHTKNVFSYMQRLFWFGVIAQIPHILFMYYAGLPYKFNILFTLLFGVTALYVITKKSFFVSIPLVIIMGIIMQLGYFEYGAYGLVLIMVNFFFLKHKKIGTVLLTGVHIGYTYLMHSLHLFTRQIFGTLSIPFLFLYNGERGNIVPRSFFYWFYPGHMFFLVIIKILFT